MSDGVFFAFLVVYSQYGVTIDWRDVLFCLLQIGKDPFLAPSLFLEENGQKRTSGSRNAHTELILARFEGDFGGKVEGGQERRNLKAGTFLPPRTAIDFPGRGFPATQHAGVQSPGAGQCWTGETLRYHSVALLVFERPFG